ncbi:MAG TPA: ATP-dependent sacrificial sulfur transferase LarE [Bacillota bacterium]
MKEVKLVNLKAYLQSLGSVAVAYSGGVDSTFLLKLASVVLGDRVLAVIARSPIFPQREFREAQDFVVRNGIRHFSFTVDELAMEEFAANPVNRCYFCKKKLFSTIKAIAAKQHLQYVAEGSNQDDSSDYRPGLQAVAELGVVSPLREIGFTKQEIRQLSHELGLPTWNKPSFACLASRFPYGEPITSEKLAMVDQAEQFLLDRGFTQVRVRYHGTVARIEILPAEFDRLRETVDRLEINNYLKELGFKYVTLDLQGYRTGSMNETLGTVDK